MMATKQVPIPLSRTTDGNERVLSDAIAPEAPLNRNAKRKKRKIKAGSPLAVDDEEAQKVKRPPPPLSPTAITLQSDLSVTTPLDPLDGNDMEATQQNAASQSDWIPSSFTEADLLSDEGDWTLANDTKGRKHIWEDDSSEETPHSKEPSKTTFNREAAVTDKPVVTKQTTLMIQNGSLEVQSSVQSAIAQVDTPAKAAKSAPTVLNPKSKGATPGKTVIFSAEKPATHTFKKNDVVTQSAKRTSNADNDTDIMDSQTIDGFLDKQRKAVESADTRRKPSARISDIQNNSSTQATPTLITYAKKAHGGSNTNKPASKGTTTRNDKGATTWTQAPKAGLSMTQNNSSRHSSRSPSGSPRPQPPPKLSIGQMVIQAMEKSAAKRAAQTTPLNQPIPNMQHQFPCISTCKQVFQIEEDRYQHFLSVHCFDGTPIPAPEEVDRLGMTPCPNCHQVFKKGLVHKDKKCKISLYRNPMAQAAAVTSQQAFREKFCSFDFETLIPGTHMPTVDELFESRAPSLRYMPNAENIRADLRKIFVAVVRSLERSYKAQKPTKSTWTFLLGLCSMLLSLPVEKRTDVTGTATIINQRIQMLFNGEFEALYNGYRHVKQSLARLAQTRKTPNPDAKMNQIIGMIKSSTGDVGRAAKRLESNASIADVTDETVWKQIEDLFGIHDPNDDSMNDYQALGEIFEGHVTPNEVAAFATPLMENGHGPKETRIPKGKICPVLTTDIVQRAIQSQSQSSSGITGWHASHLTAIADSDDGLRCVTYVLNRIYAKDMPATIFKGLQTSLLVPLTKDNGGIRPILIGDCLMRLLAKCVVEAEQRYIANRMEPIQVAVGMKGGNEMLIHGMRAQLEANPTHIAIAIDFKNAFGTIRRDAIAIELDKLDYDQSKYTRWFFNHFAVEPSHVLSPNGTRFAYTKGVPQGGPTSMQWFCLALHPALVLVQKIMEKSGGRVMASADDVFLIAESTILETAYRALVEATAFLGLVANPDKCRMLYSTDDLYEQAETLCSILGFTQEPQKALIILGTPVGNPIKESRMAKEMIKEQAFEELDKIKDLQCRMLLLRHCLNAKYLHLARTLSPNSSSAALLKVDLLVKQSLFRILDQELSSKDDDIMLEASLPISMGGLGLHILNDQRFMDYYASASAAMLRWRNILPENSLMIRELSFENEDEEPIATKENLALSLDHCKKMCKRAIETTIAPTQQDKATPEKFLQNLKIPRLPTSVEDLFSGTSPNTYKLQYQLGQVHARIMFRRVWRSILPKEQTHRAQMLAKTTGTPSLALVAIPTEPGLTLSNIEMKLMLRQYLSLPLEPTLNLPEGDIKCCCSQMGSRKKEVCKGNHLYNCQQESAFVDRHTVIVSILISALESVGIVPAIEEPVTTPRAIAGPGNRMNQTQKRFDIVAPPVSQDNKYMCMDVSIVSHVTREHLEKASCIPLHHAHESMTLKRCKYRDHYCPEYQVFVPLIAETSGAIDTNFEKLYENLATRVSGRPPLQANWAAPTFSKYWMQRTSVELWRHISFSLMKVANSSLRLNARAVSSISNTASRRSPSAEPEDHLDA